MAMSKWFGPLSQLNRMANRHAGKLLVLGLGAVALYNWRLWQRDRAFLAEKGQPEPLPPLETWSELPKVSVLVAAWNEADNIENHIASFLRLRYPHKELVLCAGGPDGTYTIAAGHASDTVVVLKQQSGEGKQRALARGFAFTQGEVIFLTDADCELSDEPFERTLWPVACNDEVAATGSLQPFAHQLPHPFVFTQAATQAYSALHRPAYVPGILGCNCTVRRALLEMTAALDVPAPSGTDYVLAKTLAAAGVAIQQIPHSRIATEYPTSARAYLRQQRRWLRNVVLHGRRFGANAELGAALRTSMIGLGMLVAPLMGIWTAPWLVDIWIVVVGQALLARLRYLGFAGVVLKRPVQISDMVWQGPFLFLDFVAWTLPLGDYFQQRGGWRW